MRPIILLNLPSISPLLKHQQRIEATGRTKRIIRHVVERKKAHIPSHRKPKVKQKQERPYTATDFGIHMGTYGCEKRIYSLVLRVDDGRMGYDTTLFLKSEQDRTVAQRVRRDGIG